MKSKDILTQERKKETMKDLLNTLERIKQHESGATLENYISAHYSAGYQFSTTENGNTNTTDSIETAAAMIEKLKGNCGIWFYKNNFYIETSYHSNSLIKAGLMAWKYKQLSIYDWKNDKYIQIHA